MNRRNINDAYNEVKEILRVENLTSSKLEAILEKHKLNMKEMDILLDKILDEGISITDSISKVNTSEREFQIKAPVINTVSNRYSGNLLDYLIKINHLSIYELSKELSIPLAILKGNTHRHHITSRLHRGKVSKYFGIDEVFLMRGSYSPMEIVELEKKQFGVIKKAKPLVEESNSICPLDSSNIISIIKQTDGYGFAFLQRLLFINKRNIIDYTINIMTMPREMKEKLSEKLNIPISYFDKEILTEREIQFIEFKLSSILKASEDHNKPETGIRNEKSHKLVSNKTTKNEINGTVNEKELCKVEKSHIRSIGIDSKGHLEEPEKKNVLNLIIEDERFGIDYLTKTMGDSKENVLTYALDIKKIPGHYISVLSQRLQIPMGFFYISVLSSYDISKVITKLELVKNKKKDIDVSTIQKIDSYNIIKIICEDEGLGEEYLIKKFDLSIDELNFWKQDIRKISFREYSEIQKLIDIPTSIVLKESLNQDEIDFIKEKLRVLKKENDSQLDKEILEKIDDHKIPNRNILEIIEQEKGLVYLEKLLYAKDIEILEWITDIKRLPPSCVRVLEKKFDLPVETLLSQTIDIETSKELIERITRESKKHGNEFIKETQKNDKVKLDNTIAIIDEEDTVFGNKAEKISKKSAGKNSQHIKDDDIKDHKILEIDKQISEIQAYRNFMSVKQSVFFSKVFDLMLNCYFMESNFTHNAFISLFDNIDKNDNKNQIHKEIEIMVKLISDVHRSENKRLIEFLRRFNNIDDQMVIKMMLGCNIELIKLSKIKAMEST